MWHTCIEGILLGFGLAIMIGPAFFSLVQTSLRRGFYAAMRLAIGIFLSDSVLVCIAFYGAAKFFEIPAAQYIISFVGGGILVGYGIYTYRSKVNVKAVIDESKKEIPLKKPIKGPSWWVDFLRGFLTNMANPATWLLWFFWMSLIMGRNTEDGRVLKWNVILFFSSALFTVLTTDLLKSLLASRLKPYVNNKTMRIVNRMVGVFLFVFGLYLVMQVLLELLGLPMVEFHVTPSSFL